MPKRTNKTIQISSEYSISEKEACMLEMAADDYSRKEIAEKVGLSIRTVEAAFNKLQMVTGTKSMGGLIGYCFQKKILP
jgi:DNA-binding CsgD family transcriptional regulator